MRQGQKNPVFWVQDTILKYVSLILLGTLLSHSNHKKITLLYL